MHHLVTILSSYAAFCVLSLFATVFLKAFYNIFFHPLRRYPGPKLWVATRLTWAYAMQSGRLHQKLYQLHEEYGSIVRIAPDELSYIDAQAWHDIYQPRAGHAVIPKNGVWAMEPAGAPQSVMSVNEAAHSRNRRALMGAFTEHAISEHASILEGHVRLMMDKFREKLTGPDAQAVVNIVDWLNWLMFDISGSLSFGSSFDSVKNGKAHPWVEISTTFGKGLALMASVNFFSPLNKILAYTVPKRVRDKMGYHKQLVHEKFYQRLDMQDKSKSQDYVGSVIQHNEGKGEKGVSMAELENDLNVLIFAGAETTGTALVSVINALLSHPEELRSVVEEVRSTFKTGDEISVANVSKLKNLTAVIQEGMRLGPPAAVALPRIVPNDGEMICGQWVPGGTFVSLNQYPAYRSPSNFTQPDSFVPARFTSASAFPSDKLTVFEPFLQGRHKCLGQKLAWAEMRLTLAHLLYAFDISSTEPLYDFGRQDTYIFWEKRPLNMEIRSRKSPT